MQEALFTMARLEDFVPSDHPLRPIRAIVNTALGGLNDLFNEMSTVSGRASIAPEKLMRSPAATGLLFDSKRAAAHGAGSLQPAVPVVRGPGDLGSGLGSLDVREEPRPADRARSGRDVLRRGDGAG